MKPKAYRTVLATTDFSPGSRAALRHVERVLPAGGRVRVHLVHVLEPLSFALPPAPIWVDYDAARRTDARQRLGRVATHLRGRLGRDVRIVPELLAGPAHEVICAAARRLRADVVVVGTHGRTGLPHVLLGSVAERVVRHAGRPVLTVPLAAARGGGRRRARR